MSSAPPPSRQAPRRRPWRPALWLVGVVGLSLLALLVAVLSLLAALRSEQGSAWLLSHLPGVEVSAPRGALLRDFSAARVQWQGNDGALLIIDELQWQRPSLRYLSDEEPHIRVSFDRLSARRVSFKAGSAPSRSGPARAPDDLSAPIQLSIPDVSIGELHLDALGDQPLRDVAARVSLGEAQGGTHRLDKLHAVWDQAAFDGALSIAAHAPFEVRAVVHARPAPGATPALPWIALVDGRGPLARLQVSASMSTAAPAGRAAPSLDARAVLAPFAAWPIASLEASTEALDLSVLSSNLPMTALSGRALVRSEGRDQPVLVDLSLDNAAAGLWNEGRLPLRHALTQVQGRIDAAAGIELRSLALELGTAQRPAGRLEGSGRWKRDAFQLDARLAQVLTAGLDARAAALSVSGPLTLQGRGLPSDSDFQAALKGELQGQALPARGAKVVPPPVTLRWQATATPSRIELSDFRASAGEALVTAKAQAQRQGATGWSLQAQSQWQSFDPRPWWRGADDSPWRAGPHRINAKIDADLSVADLANVSLATLRGKANAKIDDSVLAGVPLSGQAALQAPGGALEGSANFDAAGNNVAAQLHWMTAGDGRADRLQADIRAPALAKLGPVLRLMGAPAGSMGSLTAKVQFDGRWPQVASDGELSAEDVALGELRVANAQARWTVGTRPDSRIDVQADVKQASLGQQRIDRISLRVEGTPAAHDIAFDASTPAKPPAWTEALLENGGPTTAVVRAKGALSGDAASPTGWRGSIGEITLASGRDTLLAARDLQLAWQGGATPSVSLSPGRIQVLNGGLRIARAQWSGGAQPAVDLQAEMEPLAVAPLLSKLQPDFGWGGDLTVAGHVNVRSAPALTADVVIQRSSGDLHVREPGASIVQPLGLSDLRFAVDARDGVWHFTQVLAGSTIGVLAGAQSLRVPRDALWPAPDTPLEGVLELRVDKLETWGAWVPAGWRLAGSLHTAASFGGRFSAPELTGHMEGHGVGVRNVLEGVDLRDGEVAISLQGAKARIERFTARGGDGQLALEGDATLGDAPRAVLVLKADKLRLLGRVDRKLVVTGQGHLQLDAEALALDGRFSADEGFIDFSRADAPTLGDDVHVNRDGRPPPDPDKEAQAQTERPLPRKARNLTLDLQFALGDNLRLRGRGLDTSLRGNLRITAPGGRLAVNGNIRAENGTYAAYGQKLTIERGLLFFTGPVENPRLDIIAIRPNIDVRAGVAVSGPAQNPRVRLFSEPELPEVDKLSWLVLGRATDGLGRTETALLQRAAFALLAGENQGSTDPVSHALGLDEISLRQSDGEVRETIVTLGKQLSQRWYVGYERGLNATSGSWQLIYRIAQRFTLRAQSGLDNSLDLIWSWRWN